MAPRQSQFFSPNPAMVKGFDIEARSRDITASSGERMTLNGTISITAFLLVTVLVFGAVGWYLNNPVIGIGSVVIALVIGLIVSFKPKLAPRLAIFYALFEGLALGLISRYYESTYDGIVLQAMGLTVGIAFVLLAIYRTGAIKPSANFKLGVFAATGGIALFYIVTLILSAFGVNVPIVNSSSWIGIGFSVLVVILASANLVIDFDFIEEGVNSGAPKYMEWYGAFGVMVTLVWLYLELLRLLSKLQRR